MSTTLSSAAELGRVFSDLNRSVLGLTADLLQLGCDHGVELEWLADHCQARLGSTAGHEVVDLSISRSVFRAILARIAALCQERNGSAVSPYGGHGQVSAPGSATQLRVEYTNTPDVQKLQVVRAT